MEQQVDPMDKILFYSQELETALEAFSSSTEKTLTPRLQNIVEQISRTGLLCYPWNSIKQLIYQRLNEIFSSHFSKDLQDKIVESRIGSIIQSLALFSSAPFTIQRICELILNPSIYKNPQKYVSALEKLVNVSSTIPQMSASEYNTAVTQLISQKKELETRSNDINFFWRNSLENMDTTNVYSLQENGVSTPIPTTSIREIESKFSPMELEINNNVATSFV